MNFFNVYDSILQTGGASYDPRTGILNPKTGYMVSFKGCEQTYPMPKSIGEFQSQLVAFADANVANKLMVEDNAYLGFWLNDGKLVIDVSEHVDDLETAYLKAAKRNQLAIYDCANQETLFLTNKQQS